MLFRDVKVFWTEIPQRLLDIGFFILKLSFPSCYRLKKIGDIIDLKNWLQSFFIVLVCHDLFLWVKCNPSSILVLVDRDVNPQNI